MPYSTKRIRPNQTLKIQEALEPGVDYVTPTGSGAQLTGVVHTETDPIFTASAAHSITLSDISNWNQKLDGLTAGGFSLLTSPDGNKKGGWQIGNDGQPAWVNVS